jgi:hemoglobin
MASIMRMHVGMAVITVCLLEIGCSSMDTQAGQDRTKSLYQRLGEKPAITAVVDQFVANVANDGHINHRFATTDIPQLKTHLVEQICSASGGPCTYTGRDMKTTHAGMRITTADFNALVEDLVAALDTFKVPEQEKKELLSLLGPLKKDIVELP